MIIMVSVSINKFCNDIIMTSSEGATPCMQVVEAVVEVTPQQIAGASLCTRCALSFFCTPASSLQLASMESVWKRKTAITQPVAALVADQEEPKVRKGRGRERGEKDVTHISEGTHTTYITPPPSSPSLPPLPSSLSPPPLRSQPMAMGF